MSLKVTNFDDIMKLRIFLLILLLAGLFAGRPSASAQEPMLSVFKESFHYGMRTSLPILSGATFISRASMPIIRSGKARTG